MAQPNNFFKKLSAFMKKNPHLTRQQASDIILGKKKAPAGRVSGTKKKAPAGRVSGTKKKAATRTVAKRVVPKKVVVKKTTTTRAVSLGALTSQATKILEDKLGKLMVAQYRAKYKKDKNRLGKDIRAVKAQIRKFTN